MADNKEIDWGGQAFPTEGGVDSGLYPDPGMSLRDYFAAAVVPSLMNEIGYREPFIEVARNAYDLADAMLKARKGEL